MHSGSTFAPMAGACRPGPSTGRLWLAAFFLGLPGLSGCATVGGGEGERRVTYGCEGGPDLTILFEQDSARIVNEDGSTILLPARPAASGFWYESPTHSIRGQGVELIYTVGRMTPIRCQQNNTANM